MRLPAPYELSHVKNEFSLAPCKGIQDTLGFWIPRRGFRIPITGFQIFFSGTWIPDSNCQWDSGFLLLYSGFQGPGFRIPQTKISKIPDSKCKNFPDSGIRIPLHGAISLLGLTACHDIVLHISKSEKALDCLRTLLKIFPLF